MPSSPLPAARFDAVWRALGATGSSVDVFERLRAAYDEPHRAYHGATHIAACLRLFDEPDVRALATRSAEVEATLWYHDAIYDTHAPDNEERSAELAEDTLGAAGVAADVVERIASYVRATKDHRASSSDAELVIDVDLSILGASAALYDRFEQEIRQEYAWVEPELYVNGRTAVLRRFSDRPFIYGTGLFRDRFERRARANIGAAIERLATMATARPS